LCTRRCEAGTFVRGRYDTLAPHREVRKRAAQSGFGWGVRHVVAERHCTTRFLGTVAQRPKCTDHVIVLWIGLFWSYRSCRRLRGWGRRSLRSLLPHEPGAERAFGCVLVVASTTEAEVPDRRLAAAGELLHVIELHVAACLAAAAGLALERAPALIT
jgi:hypothetical protein